MAFDTSMFETVIGLTFIIGVAYGAIGEVARIGETAFRLEKAGAYVVHTAFGADGCVDGDEEKREGQREKEE